MEDRLAVLDRDDAARGEAAAVADAVDLVDDRDARIAGPQEVGVQRVREPAFDGAARGHQRLSRHLAAEDALALLLRLNGRGTGSPRALRGRGSRAGASSACSSRRLRLAVREDPRELGVASRASPRAATAAPAPSSAELRVLLDRRERHRLGERPQRARSTASQRGSSALGSGIRGARDPRDADHRLVVARVVHEREVALLHRRAGGCAPARCARRPSACRLAHQVCPRVGRGLRLHEPMRTGHGGSPGRGPRYDGRRAAPPTFRLPAEAREIDAARRVEADAFALEQRALQRVAARCGARTHASLRVHDALPRHAACRRAAPPSRSRPAARARRGPPAAPSARSWRRARAGCAAPRRGCGRGDLGARGARGQLTRTTASRRAS